MKTRTVEGVPHKDRVCAIIDKRGFVILNGNHILKDLSAESEILATLPLKITGKTYAGLNDLSEQMLELPGVEIDSTVWEVDLQAAATSHKRAMQIVKFTEHLAKLEDAETLLFRFTEILTSYKEMLETEQANFNKFQKSFQAILTLLDNQKNQNT